MSKKKYDAVVVFPFGDGRESYPNNVALVHRATEEAKQYSVPLIVHERMPIGECLQSALTVVRFGGKTICEYARNVKEDMARETWKNVLVVAATPIIGRCMSDLRRVYPGSVTFHDCRHLFKDVAYGLWFWSKELKYWRVRAVGRFLLEELMFFVPWPIYRWASLPRRK